MGGNDDVSHLESLHDEHGAAYVERGDRRVVHHYGRPERTHQAVRNGVGVYEQPYDVLIVTGEDRVEYVDNVVSNGVPAETGRGTYAFLLDPDGRVRMDLYCYTAEDRLLLFLPPGHAEDLAAEWGERVFIQDVELDPATADYTILTVTGPQATEKLASVISAGVPEERFAFEQATIADAGVTVIPTEGLTGEESYDIVTAAYDGEVVMDALLTRGLNAVPFGTRTWETLTLEAGTPLFEQELVDTLPNATGVRSAIDFEKGCFVGQEVVSRIENRGRANERLVGVRLEDPVEPGTSIEADGEAVGRVTRSARSPSLDRPIGLAYLPYDEPETPTVDGEPISVLGLPFVDGSATSGRLPTYPD